MVTTFAPALVRRRNTSTALNAAMLPLTPRTIVLPSSARASLMDLSSQFTENRVATIESWQATAIGENERPELLRRCHQVVVDDDVIIVRILRHFHGSVRQALLH